MILEAIAIGSLLASLGASRTIVDSALGRPLVRVVHFPSNPWPMEARAWETPEGLEFLTALAVMISKPNQQGILLSVSPRGLVLIYRTHVHAEAQTSILGKLWIKTIPLHENHPWESIPIEGIPEDQQLIAEKILLMAIRRTNMSTGLFARIFGGGWLGDKDTLLKQEALKSTEIGRNYFIKIVTGTREITDKDSLRAAIAQIDGFSVMGIRQGDEYDRRVTRGRISPNDFDFALIILQEMVSRDIPITQGAFIKLYAGGNWGGTYAILHTRQAHMASGGPLFPLGHPLRDLEDPL